MTVELERSCQSPFITGEEKGQTHLLLDHSFLQTARWPECGFKIKCDSGPQPVPLPAHPGGVEREGVPRLAGSAFSVQPSAISPGVTVLRVQKCACRLLCPQRPSIRALREDRIMATESLLPDDPANVILFRLRREWVRVGPIR